MKCQILVLAVIQLSLKTKQKKKDNKNTLIWSILFASRFGVSESLEKYCIRVTYYISAAHILSFDVAIIQCITLCHKNHMTTHVLAFWHIYAMSFTITMSAMCYFTEMSSF